MRILYFSRDYTPHDYRILSSLAKTEHQVYYLRLEKSNFTSEVRSLPPEVNLLEWGGGRSAVTWTDIPRLVREFKTIALKLKPDLVQAGPIQRSALVVALSGIRPLITMSWGYDLLQDARRNVIWRQATRFVLAHSDLMIGDCETIRQRAVSFGMPGERIVTFPWGIDLKHFSPINNSEDFRPQDRRSNARPFILLSTRGWESIYGVETIAQAFISIAKQSPELRLVMLGNGSLEPILRQTFHHAGFNPPRDGDPRENPPRVSFPGQVGYEHLPDYYRQADLYVSASHSDGTSISLLEAMACGLPVVVSDIPGNREWVVPKENGWLFKEGDSTSMAIAIREAYEVTEQLPEMGRNARRLVEKRADWSQNFQKMLEAQQSVVLKYRHV